MGVKMRTMATIDFKDWGHRLIDRLVIMGIPRETVYKRLGRRVHRNPHFGTVNDDMELRSMVNALNRMIEEIEAERIRNSIPKKQRKKQKHAQYRKEIFTDKELLREVGRRNTIKVMPWYRRWKYYAMRSLSIAFSKNILSFFLMQKLIRTFETSARSSFFISRIISR